MAIVTRRYSHVGPTTADLLERVSTLPSTVVNATFPISIVDIDIDDAEAGVIDALDGYLREWGMEYTATPPPVLMFELAADPAPAAARIAVYSKMVGPDLHLFARDPAGNVYPLTGGLLAIGNIIGGATTGGVLYGADLGDGNVRLLQSPATFFWDVVAQKMGLGTNAPGAQRLHVVYNAAAIQSERTTALLNTQVEAQWLKATSSGDMVDEFGPTLAFYIRDTANVDNVIASIGAVRAGADNTGDVVISTYAAGVSGERVRVKSDGRFWMGATTAGLNAQVEAERIKLTSTGDMVNGFGPVTAYYIRDNAGVDNVIASVGAIRSGADNTGSYVVNVYNAGVLAEATRVTNLGYYGVGVTPESPLHVKKSYGFDLVLLQNEDTTAYTSIKFRNHTGSDRGSFGHGNATAGDTMVRNRLFWRSLGSADFVISYTASTPSVMAGFISGSNGFWGIGPGFTSSPATQLHVTGQTMINSLGFSQPTFNGGSAASLIVGAGGGNWGIVSARATNDASAAHMVLFKTRATDPAIKTALQTNDAIGDLQFQGADTVGAAVVGAVIIARVTGAVAGSQLPTALAFQTSSVGTPQDKLTITSDGALLLTNSTVAANSALTEVKLRSNQATLQVSGNGSGYYDVALQEGPFATNTRIPFYNASLRLTDDADLTFTGGNTLNTNILNYATTVTRAGVQILSAQGAAVADAAGGATVDAEARTAINTLLARLRTHGIIAT